MHEQRRTVTFRLREQRLRLVGATLPATQLCEPDDALDDLARNAAEVAARGREHVLRLAPRALPDEHVGVMRAAGTEHLRVGIARGDLLDPAAPLARALEVAHPLARVDEMAADRLDDAHVRDFARHGGSRRLVEEPHAAVDVAVGDEREPLDRDAGDLEVDCTRRARGSSAVRRNRASRSRIMVRVERAVRVQIGEERMLLHRRQPLEQPARALEPAARLGLAAELQAVERELERDTCGDRLVVRVAGEPVRALVRRKRDRAVHLPARGSAEAVQRVDRLAGGERRLEVRPRLRPGRAQKRLPARGERALDGCRGAHA